MDFRRRSAPALVKNVHDLPFPAAEIAVCVFAHKRRSQETGDRSQNVYVKHSDSCLLTAVSLKIVLLKQQHAANVPPPFPSVKTFFSQRYNKTSWTAQAGPARPVPAKAKPYFARFA